MDFALKMMNFVSKRQRMVAVNDGSQRQVRALRIHDFRLKNADFLLKILI